MAAALGCRFAKWIPPSSFALLFFDLSDRRFGLLKLFGCAVQKLQPSSLMLLSDGSKFVLLVFLAIPITVVWVLANVERLRIDNLVKSVDITLVAGVDDRKY